MRNRREGGRAREGLLLICRQWVKLPTNRLLTDCIYPPPARARPRPFPRSSVRRPAAFVAV